MHTQEELELIRDENQGWLAKFSGFNGIGIGKSPEGKLCLTILTNGLKEVDQKSISKKLEEIPHQFLETGEFKHLPLEIPKASDES